MKYLLLLIVGLSCKNEPRKVVVHNEQELSTQKPDNRNNPSIDVHDPFETGKDTVRLNRAIDEIISFPEVEAINHQIDQTTNGKHGVSIRVQDEFNTDTSYYHFMVGDNSQEDRYVNLFDFLLEKKTGKIKVYEPLLDSIISLKDWRKSRK